MARLTGNAPAHRCLKDIPPALGAQPHEMAPELGFAPRLDLLQRQIDYFADSGGYVRRVTLPVEADIYRKGFIKPSWLLATHANLPRTCSAFDLPRRKMVRGAGYAPALSVSQTEVLLLHYPRIKPQLALQPARLFTKQDQEFSWGKLVLRAGLAPATALVRSQACNALTPPEQNGASPTNRTWIPTFARSCDICFTNEA